MEEKTDTKKKLPEAFFVKLLGLLIVILGCLSLFFLLFYYSLLSSAGFVVSSVLALSLCLSMTLFSKSGFDYAEKLTQENDVHLFEIVSIHIVSFFCLIISLVSFLRIIVWSAFYFLKLDIHLFDFPH